MSRSLSLLPAAIIIQLPPKNSSFFTFLLFFTKESIYRVTVEEILNDENVLRLSAVTLLSHLSSLWVNLLLRTPNRITFFFTTCLSNLLLFFSSRALNSSSLRRRLKNTIKREEEKTKKSLETQSSMNDVARPQTLECPSSPQIFF